MAGNDRPCSPCLRHKYSVMFSINVNDYVYYELMFTQLISNINVIQQNLPLLIILVELYNILYGGDWPFPLPLPTSQVFCNVSHFVNDFVNVL